MYLYHYTSMQALLGILKENHICFWGTRFDSMNDPTDYIYARDIVIPQFLHSIKKTTYEIQEIDDAYPYIVSFCKNDDDFNMWRMYKSEVSLELDWNIVEKYFEKVISDTKEKSIYWGECKYPATLKEVHQCFINLFNNSEQTENNIIDTVQECAVLIKRKEFANENEFRIYCLDYKLCRSYYNAGNYIINDCEIANNIKVKCVKNGDIILYKEFHLPKDALKGIILNIGDNATYEKTKSHLEIYLGQLGYEFDIRQSKNGPKINV